MSDTRQKSGWGWYVFAFVAFLCVRGCIKDSRDNELTYTRSHYSQPYSGYHHSAYIGTHPFVAENGSRYGALSEYTGQPKTVYVNGYYRSNGTYVRSHYRSPPR